ncbi:MAG: acetyl-CoA carboxylase subunit beta [Candidatus Lambdaproteobacteria bacterium RIFOXYD1_FULL_56_27]|uniref:Acetyl-coenzyme A carboxylase carboxyl transferase subunit beta n=1 Tax=Candidatus Lambdaproteobacteria bacterium RIFOXYD2_FULL_56_26 TaxID=1817773 RepID=A0A1F6GNP8_9PROT|nr:MAG: acetyl-CoA carboxylase subunit beta [Candidatus Lambdaproteobacteria bacterium RIFOXYD2_FULL_56_26]OGG99896.1 MAG: acetyl-CoA carboxylase subunit beta [Candidatus Lambdaproteobacteria bacterium RIFOXYC1_FULL_56_13]OGH06295.1 MAG: acetyl-CoA carboxylase subunit beta [Candidatus Lambdaproteobacteria bacterium RIFOXYD1_FULL_56_27]
MSWFKRIAPKLLSTEPKKNIPAGIWIKCPECGETLYSKDLDKNLKVCLNCSYHFRLTAEERIASLVDDGTWTELFSGILPKDPLQFTDSKKYKDRLKAATTKTKLEEAITCGEGRMMGQRVAMSVFNFRFMGGSMGSVVGEKITRTIEYALAEKLPVIIVSSSGGARMQEGALSLMQMAKTSAALYQLAQAKLPYVSLMTDPTTGGVSASFAMLGDINIAEKGALIGFAGPRVIQQTIGQQLPAGFQRAEFLLEHGAVDLVLDRRELKGQIANLLGIMLPRG